MGTTVSVDTLLAQHDAVFVGVGLGKIRPLRIPGEGLPGVHDALDLIATAKSGQDRSTFDGRAVVVLGGGNTAIDAARLATRLGSTSVTVVYRRGAEHMPAYQHEVEEALAEGVQFRYWLAPESIVGNGSVTGITCEVTQPGQPGDDGRPTLISTGQTVTVNCDSVVVATGQAPRSSLLGDRFGLELDTRGRVVVDEQHRSSNPAVWAGGDCVNGGKEVVNAVAEGMAAARSIDEVLQERRR